LGDLAHTRTHTATTTHKMRTKTLICAAAALAAGLASSVAQTVYSQNVVGYVNVVFPANSYSLVANPLNNTTGNTISNLFSASNPIGVTAYGWNGSFFAANQLDEFGGGWANPNADLSPGIGFFLQNGSTPFTNTFVGDVMQGTLTVPLPVGYSLVASKVPQTGFVQDLGVNATPGDTIYLWNGSFFAACQLDEFGGGWPPVTGFTVDNTKGPQIGVAQSFFYQKAPTSTATFVRTFTVAP
jgi:hypothetical protein